MIDPVKACCGRRHGGRVECPDGLVMCCLCFNLWTREYLNVTDDGMLEDVCRPCAEQERAHDA